jgi:hypothetical protein
VRSKQGALGSLRRADHPRPACMLSMAVGGRCVVVVSARPAGSRDSFRLRWLKLLAKSRPMSLAVTPMIGGDVLKRKCGRAVALCDVQPLLSPFDTWNLCWQATVGRGRLRPRASPAFQGHVARVELTPGASTNSTDHSRALLRLTPYMYLSITNNLPKWTNLVSF